MADEIGVSDEELAEFERIYAEDRALREKRSKAVFPVATRRSAVTRAPHREAHPASDAMSDRECRNRSMSGRQQGPGTPRPGCLRPWFKTLMW
jgi:hypothetical protein